MGRGAVARVLFAVAMLASAPLVICPARAGAVELVEAGFGKIRLDGLLQGFYHYQSRPGSINSNFRLKRAEVKFSGEVHDRVFWLVAIDPAQIREDASRKSPLQDFAVGFRIAKGTTFEFSQSKTIFGMEGSITSSAKLLFVERSLMSTELAFSDGRDIGMALRGDYGFRNTKFRAGFDFAVYNGAGQNNFDTTNRKDVAGRIRLYPASWLYFDMAHYRGWTGTIGNYSPNFRTGGSVSFEKSRWLFTSELAGGGKSGKGQMAWYVTGGFLIVPKLQTVVRYDWADPDKNRRNDLATETSLGFNYYILKNYARLTIAGTLRREQNKYPVSGKIMRIMTQASF